MHFKFTVNLVTARTLGLALPPAIPAALTRSSNNRFPSVAAPFQARGNVGVVVARGRMLSSVRPVMRQEDSRRPVWEFADRVRSPKVRSKASAVIAIDGTGGPLSVLVAKQSQPNFMRRFSESSPTPPPRPPQSLPVVRYDAKARQRSLDMLPWGLIPYWVKDINVGFANVQRKGGGHRGQASFRQSL